jgi:hypothetical protein
MTPDHPLAPLDKGNYVVAIPTESELDIRKRLLDTKLYENHYRDCEVVEVVGTIRQMLEHRMGDKAPVFRVEHLDALITIDIAGTESAHDVLFDIAARANARVFIENGEVILSRRKLAELASLDPTTSETVAKHELPSH